LPLLGEQGLAEAQCHKEIILALKYVFMCRNWKNAGKSRNAHLIAKVNSGACFGTQS